MVSKAANVAGRQIISQVQVIYTCVMAGSLNNIIHEIHGTWGVIK
jgi:hypothetical protein